MNRTTVSPGEEIEVGGQGYGAGAKVETYICSTPRLLGSAKADSNGSVIMKATIPSDVESGSHEIRMVGPNADGGTHTNVAKIEVLKPASVLSESLQSEGSQSAGLSLPKTGIQIAVGVLLALGLVSLGIALHPDRGDSYSPKET